MILEHNHRKQRGAASVEAVVALPVFVVLFIGLFFVRDMTAARLEVDQEVRRCSWQYALQTNCGDIPPGCEHVVGSSHYGSLTPDFDGAFDGIGKDSGSLGSKGYAAVMRIVENFIIDYLAQALTKRFDANKVTERERPNLFGGGTTRVSAEYGLACNVPAQSQQNVMTAVWNQFKP
jgi:hypothetical protein